MKSQETLPSKRNPTQNSILRGIQGLENHGEGNRMNRMNREIMTKETICSVSFRERKTKLFTEKKQHLGKQVANLF